MDRHGLYRKYNIERTDGDPTGKHGGCEYFVLDVTHDKAARRMLSLYASEIEHDRPALALDLRTLLRLCDLASALEGFQRS